MNKIITIISMVLISSTVFAAQGSHCVRGGGISVNLPSNAYHLYMTI